MRDSSNYIQKASLAKKKESGRVLLAEEEHWLNSTDSESEGEDQARICLMVKTGGVKMIS